MEKEYLISSFPAKWIDTLFRFHRYHSNGCPSTVIDSPRVNDLSYATYEATCDTAGRIIKVNSCRNAPNLPAYTPKVITNYYWITGNTVAFASRDTDDAVLDTGFIQASGKIRIVRLPQNETLPAEIEKQLIVVVSDSTNLFDKDGGLINTYYWQFDSLGNDTSWHYRKPGGQKQWVNSYSNAYRENGLLDRRSPAMTGPEIKYSYSNLPVPVLSTDNDVRHRHGVHATRNRPLPYGKAFLANGRMLPLSVAMHLSGIYIAKNPEATRSASFIPPVLLMKTRE